MRGDIFQSLFSSCPLKKKKKKSGSQAVPQEKESGSENISQRFFNLHCGGCRSDSVEGRNLHIKMYLNPVKNVVSILQLASYFTLILHTMGPSRTHRKATTLYMAGSTCFQSRPLPPQFFPFQFEKALFYLHIQELVGLVCFFGTINKKKQLFLLVLLISTYQSGYVTFSSTQDALAKWTYECMHSDRILLPKWNVGICYAPQVEKWLRNQDLKGDI